jgi:hypothetical protein
VIATSRSPGIASPSPRSGNAGPRRMEVATFSAPMPPDGILAPAEIATAEPLG